MRGVQVTRFGTPDVLEYTNLPDPGYDEDQVLIEVHGASVNYADIKARSGAHHLGKVPPFIPGIDIAGVVLEVGSGVKDIVPGDHVIAFPSSGAYAEKAVAGHEQTFVIPENLDLTRAAAAALVSCTVVHMLKQVARMEAGETLLVHAAAGGVGTTALQIAKALGVSPIFGSVGSPWKETHLRRIGVQGVVDYHSADYGKEVLDMTGGRGVNVILNPLGGETIGRDLHCLAPFGRLVLFGQMNQGVGHLPPDGLYTKNRAILGCSFGHYRRCKPEGVRQTMNAVIDLLMKEQIAIQVDSCLPLEQARQAHRLLEERRVVGKIVLVPGKFFRQASSAVC